MLVTEQLESYVTNCYIMDSNSDCSSDHLPVITKLSIPVEYCAHNNSINQTYQYEKCNKYPKPLWSCGVLQKTSQGVVRIDADSLKQMHKIM